MSCNQMTFKLARLYLSSLDTPRALAVWLMFANNEHDQLVELDIDPNRYLEPESFRLDYLATCFLSKANFLSVSFDRKKKALDKFWAAERSCAEVNRNLSTTTSLKTKSFDRLHHAIRRQIDRILGSFSADEWFERANWGPGVTLDTKRDTSSTNKFRQEVGITQDLHFLVGDLLAVAYPTWDLTKVKIHIGNKVVTVPKNSKTDRVIAVEPGLNLWFQKGIGSMIRRRLSRVGVNLNSQSRNQQLAYQASLSSDLATIDFSSASDTISIETVRELLPSRWFSVMDSARSMFCRFDGQVRKYEKFSSMGNGFTFELESLIFYAIGLEVCKYLQLSPKNLSVYGDDVIIPVEAVNLFSDLCKIYGFTVNNSKSFSSGWFRESCGSHFFRGLDCKPYFLKEVIDNEHSRYVAANSIRRLSRNHSLGFCDIRFKSSFDFLRYSLKNPCLISEGYGDAGFIVNFDEACPSRARHGIEGYRTLALLTVPKGYYSDDHPLLLARLKGRSATMSFGNITHLRGRVKLLRKKLFIRQWTHLGEWF